ncbi:MAG: hypothetical protein QM817_35700 [Archangium sp.]
MSRHSLFLAAALSVLGGASSCGTPPKMMNTCGPSNCSGCCDAAGQCQVGTTPLACGVFGAMCQTCGSGLCQSGVCSTRASGGGGGATGGGGGSGGGTGGGVTGGGVGGGGVTGGGVGGGGVTGGGVGGGGVTGGGVGGGGVTGGGVGGGGVTGGGVGGGGVTGGGGGVTGGGGGVTGGGGGVTGGGGGVTGGGTGGGGVQPGDQCSNAMPLSLSGGFALESGTLTGYSHHLASSCSGTLGPDRAYIFTTTAVQNFDALLTGVSGFRGTVQLQQLTNGLCTSAVNDACQTGSAVNGDVTVSRPSLPAGTWLVWVEGSTTGTFQLEVQLSTPTTGSGETCSSPIALNFVNNVATVSGDTTPFLSDSTANSGSPCNTNGSGPDVVYSFTLAMTSTVTVTVTPSTTTYRPIAYVRNTCAAVSDLACSLATAAGGTATFTQSLPAGTYFLTLDTFSTSSGPYTLNVTIGTTSSGSASDTCTQAASANPLIAASGTINVQGTTSGFAADLTSGAVNGCSGSGGGADAIYVVDHVGTGSFTASVTASGGSGFTPIMYLRTTCASSTTDVTCAPNDNGNCTFTTGSLTVPSLAQGRYYLVVDTCGTTNMGSYTLTVTQ